MSSPSGRILALGAVTAGIAVAVGAFGAHALEGSVSADMLANYETGARYHFYHSLGIVAIGIVALILEGRDGAGSGGTGSRDAASGGTGSGDAAATTTLSRLRWAAWLMLAGVVLFSGSLYAMALTGQRWLGAVTPLGGVSFIVAWALLAWAAASHGRR